MEEISRCESSRALYDISDTFFQVLYTQSLHVHKKFPDMKVVAHCTIFQTCFSLPLVQLIYHSNKDHNEIVWSVTDNARTVRIQAEHTMTSFWKMAEHFVMDIK